jgi:hypothetical protein
MPAATLSDLGLGDKSPQDLEAIRREIVAKLTTEYKGYDDPEVPMDLLNRLAVVTSSLRRKNAGPPKVVKTPKASKAKSTDDFVI